MDKDLRRIAKKIVDMIYNEKKARPEPYDTTATVRRVENGRAFVHIPGGVDETPVKMGVNVEPGDEVEVNIGGGKASIGKDFTNPPTDDKTARKAQTTATKARETAKAAETKAEDAQITANEALEDAEHTAQYFWSRDGDDSEAGAHVTQVPQEEFEANPQGGNILMRSNSLRLRMALITLAELTGTAFKFYDPATHEERLQLNASGVYLKGQLITGTYSYAQLLSKYLNIGYYNGSRNVVSDYLGNAGFDNFIYSRKQIATVGSHPIFSSTVVDKDGVKIIHDDSDTPYDTPSTGSFKATLANLEDDTLLLQNVDNYGNEYQTVEINAEYGGGIVITAKDENGNQNEIFKLEGTYDTSDASNSYAELRSTLETPTVSISATTGTLVSAEARRFGQVVQLWIQFRNTASIAAGANVFEGTLNTTGLRPVLASTGAGFFGTHSLVGYLPTTGALVVRNASTTAITISSAQTASVSFTYLIA